MKRSRTAVAILFILVSGVLQAQKTISFFSGDGVMITADLYHVSDSLPYMILCHQAFSSRGEYLETAERFTKFGYNCLAIDARSGEEICGVVNQTAIIAKYKGRTTRYVDAEQDIRAAIKYVSEISNKPVVLVGSTYSASLVMKIAINNSDVKAVIAFSPGEYFGSSYSVKDSIHELKKPLFVTSSKDEAPAVSELVAGVKSRTKQQYTPSMDGVHGAKMLWESNPNYKEYWTALMMFMLRIKV